MTQINSGSTFSYMPNSTSEGCKMEATYPQIVNLQWSSNNGSSPNSALNTTYELQIVEVYPDDRDPNEAFRTQFIYSIPDLTEKSFILRADDYALVPGKNYAVRLKVIDNSGLELFKNQGFSPAYKFKYGEKCLIPFGFTSTIANFSQSKITWTPQTGNTEYVLKYREKGQTDWYTQSNILFTNYQINSLNPGREYEYRIHAYCGSIQSEESEINTFSIPQKDKDAFVCGTAGAKQSIPIGTPKVILNPGDEINAGKYTLHVYNATGSNGEFSGIGYLTVPFLKNAKMQVEFNKLQINTDNVATKGLVKVTGARVNAISDELRSNITVITTEVRNITGKAEAILNDAEKQINEANGILNDVKNLPAEAKKAIEDGKSLIAQGKAMVAAGNNAEGESLIEQGKKKLNQGAKGAIDAARNGGAALTQIVAQSGDKLKELVQKVLDTKKTESESGKTSSTSDASKEDGELATSTKEIHKDRNNVIIADDDPNEESELEDAVAWEVQGDNRTISKTEEEGVAKLSGRNRALLSMNKIINYLDKLAEYDFIMTLAISYLKGEALLKLVNEIKEDAPDAAKQLIQGYISGNGTTDLEKYLKEYIDKKINEQLTNAIQR